MWRRTRSPSIHDVGVSNLSLHFLSNLLRLPNTTAGHAKVERVSQGKHGFSGATLAVATLYIFPLFVLHKGKCFGVVQRLWIFFLRSFVCKHTDGAWLIFFHMFRNTGIDAAKIVSMLCVNTTMRVRRKECIWRLFRIPRRRASGKLSQPSTSTRTSRRRMASRIYRGRGRGPR